VKSPEWSRAVILRWAQAHKRIRRYPLQRHRQASNAGQRQINANPTARAEVHWLRRFSFPLQPLRGCASLAPAIPPFCLSLRPAPGFQHLLGRVDGVFQFEIMLRSNLSAARGILTQEEGHRDYADLTLKSAKYHAFLIAPTAIKSIVPQEIHVM